MPPAYRLTIADLKAFRADRRLSGTHFTLSIGALGRTGVAVVISKKVAARAVDRNTIKRRSRAALLPFLHQLPPGAYVFYAKKEAKAATSAEIVRDLTKLLDRLA